MNQLFTEIASHISFQAGRARTFILAMLVILVWAVTGPLFAFSDTWQLVINTGTTIVTFLMVFLIQNTQNRDQQAIHLKLDELLRAVDGAREGAFVDLEDRNQEELEELKKEIFAECMPGETDEEHKNHLLLAGHSDKTSEAARRKN